MPSLVVGLEILQIGYFESDFKRPTKLLLVKSPVIGYIWEKADERANTLIRSTAASVETGISPPRTRALGLPGLSTADPIALNQAERQLHPAAPYDRFINLEAAAAPDQNVQPVKNCNIPNLAPNIM